MSVQPCLGPSIHLPAQGCSRQPAVSAPGCGCTLRPLGWPGPMSRLAASCLDVPPPAASARTNGSPVAPRNLSYSSLCRGALRSAGAAQCHAPPLPRSLSPCMHVCAVRMTAYVAGFWTHAPQSPCRPGAGLLAYRCEHAQRKYLLRNRAFRPIYLLRHSTPARAANRGEAALTPQNWLCSTTQSIGLAQSMQ